MASKCEICGIECNGKTCSGSCRAKLHRRTRTGLNSARAEVRTRGIAPAPGPVTSPFRDDTGCDVIPDELGVTSLSYAQLMSAIKSYAQDTWVNSAEYTELMRRLHAMSLAELQAEGYWIPAWKHVEHARQATGRANAGRS